MGQQQQYVACNNLEEVSVIFVWLSKVVSILVYCFLFFPGQMYIHFY